MSASAAAKSEVREEIFDGAISWTQLAASLLKELGELFEQFPVIKAVGGLTCEILDLIDTVKENRSECERLATWLEPILIAIADDIRRDGSPNGAASVELQDYEGTLKTVKEYVTKQKNLKMGERVLRFGVDKGKIKELDKSLNLAFQRFVLFRLIKISRQVADNQQALEERTEEVERSLLAQYRLTQDELTTLLDRHQVAVLARAQVLQDSILLALQAHSEQLNSSFVHHLDEVNRGLQGTLPSAVTKHLVPVLLTMLQEHSASTSGLPASVESLPYAKGASWHSGEACFAGTRQPLLDAIKSWITGRSATQSAQVYVLYGVAGIGKSAIAHSMSQLAATNGWLVTSFFFNRIERNSPAKLITTMARDLAGKNKEVARYLDTVLEGEPSLRTSPDIVQQFESLVAAPDLVSKYDPQRRYVIVLDALDECTSDALLDILSARITALPDTFRILVTSRHLPRIERAFILKSHITTRTLRIEGTDNEADVNAFVQHRISQIRLAHQMDSPWPSPAQQQELIERAGGLFLWIKVMLDWLAEAKVPDHRLGKILSTEVSFDPEKTIEVAYGTVLAACPWKTDEDFAEAYHLFMGTVLAAKEPITLRALRQLHPGCKLDPKLVVFSELRPLLYGYESEDEPIRLLHLSLREYLTKLAPTPYLISERYHSQSMALICIQLLNRSLTTECPGVGWSDEGSEDTAIPPPVGSIDDALRYACCYWMDHLVDVDQPEHELLQALRQLFTSHIVQWAELSACLGYNHPLGAVWPWIRSIGQPHSQKSPSLLSWFKEGWHIPRRATEPWPLYEDGLLKLAIKLLDISARFAAQGRREEAVMADKDALTLLANLPSSDAGHNKKELAMAFDSLSRSLAGVDNREQALQMSKDAVRLHHELAKDRP
ncbi:hypothetical protein CALVIDRAFT_415882, partial [Calocera viscosa TUFC12733]